MEQGRSKGTPSAQFESLIINCHIEFINLFIFNCLMSNKNFFIFNCLTSNFCFEKRIFCEQNRMVIYGRILNSPRKMMTCYLRDTNKFLRYRTLCTSVLTCRFPTECIKLAWSVFFEAPEVPQLWGTSE